jgi:hypothetical protein
VKNKGNINVKNKKKDSMECEERGKNIKEIEWQKDGGKEFKEERERRMKVMKKDDVFFIMKVKKVEMGK